MLLEVRNLRTGFGTDRGIVWAVDDVSFDVQRGKTLGIVGESGSGKTVLSRSIMSLFPGSNVERHGQVIFDGVPLDTLSRSELRHFWGARIAMVFQDPMTSLNPVVRIERQLTESMRLHLDMAREEARERAAELLRSVQIPEPQRRLRQFPHQLSGGMRQRVSIAIAQACEPDLIIADEPTTALDVTVQRQILDLLDQQQQERRMAMMLITHDLGVVAMRTDEIAVMYAGQIVEKAPTPELFSSTMMPYTEALLKSIPRLGGRPHGRLEAIEGRPPDLANPPKGCRFAPRCPYAQHRCEVEAPPLRLASDDHWYRCWYPITDQHFAKRPSDAHEEPSAASDHDATTPANQTGS